MSNVVKFEAHGKRYDLSVIDKDGQKWVVSQQLGEALGVKNIRSLIRDLQNNGELKEGKHCCRITRQKTTRGNPNTLVLSYRGVIRVAMRAQGSRAKLFRDWAEDVLIEVMATGSYGPETARWDDPDRGLAIKAAEASGVMRGLSFLTVFDGMAPEIVHRVFQLRNLGLSQVEAARACRVTRDQVQGMEAKLRDLDIRVPGVNTQTRAKKARESFVRAIVSQSVSQAPAPELLQ